jgi:alginate O-acetyltransferase complex protein AlgI
MVFSSIIFLFLCLPIMLSVNYLLPKWLSNPWLLVSSLFFYAWGETVYLWVMLLVIALNYGFGLVVGPGRGPRVRGWALALAVTVNLAILAGFKYANFLVDNLNVALGAVGLGTLEIGAVHLPLGISFFTFQAMSYVIDVYRGSARVARNPMDLGLYIALFPQLIAGPIIEYEDVAEQIRDRRVTLLGTSYGIRRFLLGLAKKVLIANTLAVPADQIFGLPADQLTPALAWLGILCYTLQIYFDFSGYSDMAIGIGHMLGFRFMENFRWPYISQSIREFWRRWHISLSSWFRDYLYIPLGGNRHGGLRTGFNLVLVFFLCGLWHGASWTFVVWGLYHGAFLVLERSRFGAWMDAMPRPVRHAYVLLAVMVGWVFFRAESFDQAWRYLGAMAGFAEGAPTLRPIGYYLRADFLLALGAGLVCATPLWTRWVAWREHMASAEGPRAVALDHAVSVAGLAAYMTLFFLCAVQLSSGALNPFIYFRF